MGRIYNETAGHKPTNMGKLPVFLVLFKMALTIRRGGHTFKLSILEAEAG